MKLIKFNDLVFNQENTLISEHSEDHHEFLKFHQLIRSKGLLDGLNQTGKIFLADD